MSLRLGSIVDALGGMLIGEAEQQIDRLASLETAGHGALTFLANPKYSALLPDSRAACVIVGLTLADAARRRHGACIVVDQPYLYFARVTQLWKRAHQDDSRPRLHPSAVIDPEAQIDPEAHVGALCVIERGARIGAGTVLKSRVTVGENCRVGERCVIHPGVVIGGDGFGFAPNAGAWEKIEQLGAVRIGNDVDIGANTCIDRGALEDTVIEDGVKLDNLIQIAHNVRIGRHTAMAGCVGVAGSAVIGAHCTFGGAAMIAGHLTIADHVNISPGTLISRSIAKPGTYTGFFPMDDNAAWEKNAAALRQLSSLRERIKALERSRRP